MPWSIRFAPAPTVDEVAWASPIPNVVKKADIEAANRPRLGNTGSRERYLTPFSPVQSNLAC